MKDFSLAQWAVIIILSLLTALEPLCIDLYLPGFLQISEAFSAPIASVQISLSTFLGGFALGQLIWGPLADKFGRKKPILISLFVFILASIASLYVRTIEQLWVIRFLQALSGCGGVVISRAVVTDYFDKDKTLKIFALLALIMGVAPIVAPSLGNTILLFSNWKGLFAAMLFLGIALFLLVLFFLPETHKNKVKNQNKNVFVSYWEIFRVRKFLVYSVLAGIVNGALMVYVANGPFLIMEKGGFSGYGFSLIFTINAVGLMIASYMTSVLQKYIPANKLVKHALVCLFSAGFVLLAAMYLNTDIRIILVILFFYVFPLGVLLPTTTELAITPFINNSGTASALFGSIQLLIAFICSLVSNFISDGTLVTLGISLFLCGLIGFIIVFIRINPQNELVKENMK